MNQLVPLNGITTPTLVVTAGERASVRFLEFFASAIRNPHTRRAYARAVGEFLAWCAGAGVPSFPRSLTTTPFERSSTGRFEACPCRPASEGQLPSSVQHHKLLACVRDTHFHWPLTLM